MRIRRVSPVLLLFIPSIAIARPDVDRNRLEEREDGPLTKDEVFRLTSEPRVAEARAIGTSQKTQQTELHADATLATSRSTQTRAYVGTNDAPVDGLDGKPHAGPFVDTTPERVKSGSGKAGATTIAKAKPTSLEKFAAGSASGEDGWRVDEIPEKLDGVMNDENRRPPKKGTTGTGGGISEKDKERKAKGNLEVLPQEPKEAPPLPHSEQERIEAQREKKDDREKPSRSKKEGKEAEEDAGKDVKAPKKKGGEYGAGGYGLEKPTDLPEKPHNIPHPDPRLPTSPGPSAPKDDGAPESPWLIDTMPYTEGQTNPKPPSTTLEWHEWFHSFVLSLAMILFSEIGDKTFLIAALMAMRHPRLLVFSAAWSALIAMTVLSAILGHAVPTLLPKRLTTFAAAVLFIVFGVRMLREGLAMPRSAGVGEEMKEVEAELEEKEHHLARRASRRNSVSPFALEAGRGGRDGSKSPRDSASRSPSPAPRKDRMAGLVNLMGLVLSPAWVQTFIMTFLGEWGDRSQIATIAMAAGQDYWWVTLGAISGHAVCTGLAVMGGRALAGRVSMRVVTIGGAGAFIVFGVIYLYECLTE